MANPNPKPIPAEKRGRRPVGSPNKVTTNLRESIQRLCDQHAAPNLERWLREIERDNGPKEAIKAMALLMEFAMPKLGRTELVGKDGGDINVSIRWADE